MQSAESTDPNEPSEPSATKQAESSKKQQESTTKQQESTTKQQESTQEQVPVDPNDVNAKTLAQLNTLMEESLQIYELEDQKTNVIDDLHNALQVITQFLGFSTNVHPEIFNMPPDATITFVF